MSGYLIAGGALLTALFLWSLCRMASREEPSPTAVECPATADELLRKLRDSRRDTPYDYEIDGL